MRLFYIFIILPLCIIISFGIRAQKKINYAEHIRPILQNHCVRCHRPDNVAPFSLLNYEDAASRAGFIEYVTTSKYMPPWRADTSFSRFKNENVLTAHEIELIQKWVSDGRLKGKINKKTPISLTQNDDEIFSNIGESKTFSMRGEYTIPGDLKENFKYFHIPFNNSDTLYISGIHFSPGNKKLVHHSRVMTDTTLTLSGIDGLSADDTATFKFQTKPLADPFLFGWVPGNNAIHFPEKTSKILFPHTDILFNIHYAPTPVNEKDLSRVTLTLSKIPSDREIKTLTITEDFISNKPFFLPANKESKFYMKYGPLREDISLISVMPHMHLLGKSFRSFAITPDGELIKLIHIPVWDFNWQMTYGFRNFIKLPKGSILYAEGEYDNTDKNPRNPFLPPKNITSGWGTKDEMMNLIFYYVDYKSGDENISL